MSSVAAVSERAFIAHIPWVVRFIRRGTGRRSQPAAQPSSIVISEGDLGFGDAKGMGQHEMGAPVFTE